MRILCGAAHGHHVSAPRGRVAHVLLKRSFARLEAVLLVRKAHHTEAARSKTTSLREAACREPGAAYASREPVAEIGGPADYGEGR